MEKNIFEKIRDGESPAEIIFKNEYVTAFKDIAPNAPVHILIIPNKMIPSLSDIQEEDSIYISNIFLVVKQIAENRDSPKSRQLINSAYKAYFLLVGSFMLVSSILLFLFSEYLLNKYPIKMKEKPYIYEPTIGSSLKKLTILVE